MFTHRPEHNTHNRKKETQARHESTLDLTRT